MFDSSRFFFSLRLHASTNLTLGLIFFPIRMDMDVEDCMYLKLYRTIVL